MVIFDPQNRPKAMVHSQMRKLKVEEVKPLPQGDPTIMALGYEPRQCGFQNLCS